MPDDQAINIVLNAVNATGPATQAASQNIQQYAQVAAQANQSIGDSASDGGGLASFIGGLFSIEGLAIAAGAAIVGLGVAVYTNFAGIGDIAKDIGNSILDVFNKVTQGSWTWGSVFESVVRGVVKAFAVIEYTVFNFRDVWDTIITGTILGIVKFSNQIEYVFTVVVPKILQFALTNWRDGLTAIKVAILSAFGQSVSQEDATTFARFASGAIGTFQKLPEREVSAFEAELQRHFGEVSSRVGQGMAENIAKRLAQVPAIMSFLTETVPDFLKDFISGFTGGAIGQAKAKTPSFALPSLINERFTTGVQQQGEQQLNQALASLRAIEQSQKQQQGIVGRILDTFTTGVPRPIKEGVKAGIEAANPKIGGINLGN